MFTLVFCLFEMRITNEEMILTFFIDFISYVVEHNSSLLFSSTSSRTKRTEDQGSHVVVVQ